MSRISNNVVEYFPATGEARRSNPIPSRAIKQRDASPYSAANASGVGVVAWDDVVSYSKKDVSDFQRKYEIGRLLLGNEKTNKPRPSGRLGVIKGLSLAPHFYANMLAQVETKSGADTGPIRHVNKHIFNAFNGRSRATASESSGVPQKELLDFCAGASPFCRQTCLVLTGNNPSANDAAHAKMKYSNALLEEPALFLALLHRQLQGFGETSLRNGVDAVVRLNMLSDIPWYVVCPELLMSLEGLISFYDYTKVPFWGDPEYENVSHLLDLTFSYSGSRGNEALCAEALEMGKRVAVVFAPSNAERSTATYNRTTWEEILASGLVSRGKVDLFGGRWEIVDGDESDYRIDDPQPCIVALNFKQPNVSELRAPHMRDALPESRLRFTKKVPDADGRGETYASARARRHLWRNLPEAEVDRLVEKYPEAQKVDKDGYLVGVVPEKLPAAEVIAVAERYPAGERRKNPLEVVDDTEKDASFSVDARTSLLMAPIEGTNLLIGPHVPTVLND